MDYHSDNNKSILLSTAYLPPVAYLKAIVHSDELAIERYENYIKQTYRNRCKIYAANGLMSLSVPVEMATNKKILTKDVKIDYHLAWQKQHLRSIESAYGTSPYFDYLIDDFLPFYTKPYTFLLDFNLGLLNVVFDILQVEKSINLTTDYEHHPLNKTDLRNSFSPKKEYSHLEEHKPYPQVFNLKYGFQAGLSCIDLIFNLGTNAYCYLIDKY
jgi:hypothetical protein